VIESEIESRFLVYKEAPGFRSGPRVGRVWAGTVTFVWVRGVVGRKTY